MQGGTVCRTPGLNMGLGYGSRQSRLPIEERRDSDLTTQPPTVLWHGESPHISTHGPMRMQSCACNHARGAARPSRAALGSCGWLLNWLIS